MKQLIINLYSFDELSEQSQQKAIESLWDLNVMFEWWESTYEDAKNIGLEITSFDIDRGSYCKGTFIAGGEETAHKIEKEHGKDCETYKTAAVYLQARDKIVDNAPKDEYGDYVSEYSLEEDLDECDAEFLKSLLEDYRIILSKEYDYLTSKEQIIESIKANEYTFEESGKLNNG